MLQSILSHCRTTHIKCYYCYTPPRHVLKPRLIAAHNMSYDRSVQSNSSMYQYLEVSALPSFTYELITHVVLISQRCRCEWQHTLKITAPYHDKQITFTYITLVFEALKCYYPKHLLKIRTTVEKL
jgi:hypothetical protein